MLLLLLLLLLLLFVCFFFYSKQSDPLIDTWFEILASSDFFCAHILFLVYFYFYFILFAIFAAIIDKTQDIKKTEEEMEATRIELAQKNMQIQSLQYDLYKLKEKYDNDTRSLSKEVEWGREKVGSLKLEIRRLKEHEADDTISIMR